MFSDGFRGYSKGTLAWYCLNILGTGTAWKCPDTDQKKTPYLDTFTTQISVFSPNIWKYRPEKTSYLDTFHAGRYLSAEWHLHWLQGMKLKTIKECAFHIDIDEFPCSPVSILRYSNFDHLENKKLNWRFEKERIKKESMYQNHT